MSMIYHGVSVCMCMSWCACLNPFILVVVLWPDHQVGAGVVIGSKNIVCFAMIVLLQNISFLLDKVLVKVLIKSTNLS